MRIRLAFGYDVGKISEDCLVYHAMILLLMILLLHRPYKTVLAITSGNVALQISV